MIRRISTLKFSRRAVAHLDNGQKLAEAIERPMVREILDTMDAHEGARFFILGPVQGGKTALGQLRLLRNHWVRGTSALWYSPTDDFWKDFVKLKLNPLFEAIPEMQAMVQRGDRTKNAKDAKILVGGASHLVLSAGVENDRTGKTGRDIYRDESHLWEPGWMIQTSNRRADYPEEFSETDMSTGLIAGTDAAAAWAQTDQRTWHCRCPKCAELFEPRFAHYDAERQIVGGLRYTRKFLANGLPDDGL